MNGQKDIEVLREMVRLAEGRRAEMLVTLERVNKYNLGLIAFSGSFLSLFVTTDFNKTIVEISGFSLFFQLPFHSLQFVQARLSAELCRLLRTLKHLEMVYRLTNHPF